MSDTTTTLNPGIAGDVMDEELSTQSDGVTQAKSPRVVIRQVDRNESRVTNTDGSIQLPTMDVQGHKMLEDIAYSLREIKEMIFEALLYRNRS